MTDPQTPGTTPQNGLVAESDLTYEAPENAPDPTLDDELASFISNYEQGEPAFEEPEVAEDPETPTPEPEAPEQEDDIVDPKLARGVERLVARELAAKAERDAADRSIAEMKRMQAEFEKYKDLPNTKNLAEQFDLDPLGAFKALGKDPTTVIKLAMAQQLGDEAPAALKEFAREAGTKRRIAELEARLVEREQSQRAAEYFNTIQAGAREYVTKVGDSTPTLSLAAKADPDYVRDEIMEEIVSEARKQAATNPNGEPISYEEAAKRVETRFARLAKLFQVQNGTNSATKNVKKPNVAPPVTKQATKPLAPWQRKADSIEEQGLAEAMRVFEQAEAARKANRLK